MGGTETERHTDRRPRVLLQGLYAAFKGRVAQTLPADDPPQVITALVD